MLGEIAILNIFLLNSPMAFAFFPRTCYTVSMSEKHSEAQRERWAKVDPKERSKFMKELAIHQHSLLSPRQRRRNAMRMVAARKKK